MSTDRTAARRAEEELLARLGLDRGANPLAVETARDGIVGFLGTAPLELRRWADRQVALTDEAYAILADPTADLASIAARFAPATAAATLAASTAPGAAPIPNTVAAAATSPGVARSAGTGSFLARLGPAGRAVVGGIAAVVLVVGVYAVYVSGQPAVPPMSGTPAPETSAAAVDQAQVGELMGRISADPTDVAAYRELTDVYFAGSDYANALVFAKKVVELDPASAIAQVAVGAAYYNTGDIANAETAWLTALELDPENIEAHYDLGYLYLTKDPAENEKARVAWETVLELDPDSEIAAVVKSHMGSLLDASAGSAVPSASPSAAPSGSPTAGG